MEELEDIDRQFPVLNKNDNDYIDFIAKPIALLADPVKQLVEKYEPRLPCKPVILMEQAKLKQVLYWLIIPPQVACLSAQTEFHLDGTLKKIGYR